MSGPSTAQAPQGYQPVNQAGADASFQGGVGALNSGASALQNQVVPQYASITQGVANNPYYDTAQAYAGLTSGLAGNTVAPNQFGAGQNQYASGDNLTGLANGLGLDMKALQNSGYLPLAQQILGTSMGAGQSILNTGFDPQNDLYNRNYQQQQDQQNAINAMNGVSGTPYGAGVSGDASRNFNLDWQNNQLNREATAASAYGGLINSGVSGYNGVLGGTTGAIGSLAGGISNLTGAAGGAYKTGSDLQTGGLQTLRTAGQEQNQTYLQQQQAMLDALNGQVTGTNSAYGLTQQGISDQGNYLNIGQTATTNAQSAISANNKTNSETQAGIGSLIGTVASFIPW